MPSWAHTFVIEPDLNFMIVPDVYFWQARSLLMTSSHTVTGTERELPFLHSTGLGGAILHVCNQQWFLPLPLSLNLHVFISFLQQFLRGMSKWTAVGDTKLFSISSFICSLNNTQHQLGQASGLAANYMARDTLVGSLPDQDFVYWVIQTER